MGQDPAGQHALDTPHSLYQFVLPWPSPAGKRTCGPRNRPPLPRCRFSRNPVRRVSLRLGSPTATEILCTRRLHTATAKKAGGRRPRLFMIRKMPGMTGYVQRRQLSPSRWTAQIGGIEPAASGAASGRRDRTGSAPYPVASGRVAPVPGLAGRGPTARQGEDVRPCLAALPAPDGWGCSSPRPLGRLAASVWPRRRGTRRLPRRFRSLLRTVAALAGLAPAGRSAAEASPGLRPSPVPGCPAERRLPDVTPDRARGGWCGETGRVVG